MRLRWYGQSAFLLTGSRRVFLDPFGDLASAVAGRGLEFRYPPIERVEADLLLITHEHVDHNHAEAVSAPAVIRATAGTFESPVGDVVAVASEHDDVAGTKRGPNAIFRFSLDGLRVCHMGDFGQAALRPEQREAIGDVDLLLLPVGGGPTVGGATAATVAGALRPRLVVPMHYRSAALNFLEPPDAFLEAFEAARVERPEGSEIEVEALLGTADDPVVALPAPPGLAAER